MPGFWGLIDSDIFGRIKSALDLPKAGIYRRAGPALFPSL